MSDLQGLRVLRPAPRRLVHDDCGFRLDGRRSGRTGKLEGVHEQDVHRQAWLRRLWPPETLWEGEEQTHDAVDRPSLAKRPMAHEASDEARRRALGQECKARDLFVGKALAEKQQMSWLGKLQRQGVTALDSFPLFLNELLLEERQGQIWRSAL